MKFSAKLSILLLSITVSVVVIVSLPVYTLSHKALKKQIHHNLRSYAVGTLDTIDRTLFERFADMKVLACDSIISSPESTLKQITARLIEYRNKYKTYASLSFFDMNRIRIADTSGMKIGKQHQPALYFQNALDKEFGLNIAMSESLKAPVIYFSSLVKDNNGEAFGFVVARTPLSKLHDMIAPALAAAAHDDQQKLEGPEGMEIDLIDADGLLLYSNYNRKGILKDNLPEYKEFKAALADDDDTIVTIYDPIEGDNDLCVHAHERGHLDFSGSGWILMVRLPVEVAFASVIQLRNAMAAISIAVVAVAIAASLLFSRTISTPITILRDAAAEIGKGRLDTRIESTSKDEIGQLAASFNQMTENLQKSTTSINNLNAVNQKLEFEIAERKQAEQALEASNKELEETVAKLTIANRDLKDFVYIASHDLREPSRKISSFGQILAESLAGKLSDDEQENLGFMVDGAERMQEMIGSLLVYSKVTTKDVTFEEVDLNEMIEQLKDLELADKLEETKASVLVPETLPPINGDHSQIRQLLQNLIANALKYHRESVSPEVTVRALRQDGMVRIEVEDNGIGIEENHYNNIFVMFRRLHTRQEYSGAGIGLAVCKKIVERHNGEIGVSSIYGQGSTFWFTVPAAKIAGREQEKLVSSLTT